MGLASWEFRLDYIIAPFCNPEPYAELVSVSFQDLTFFRSPRGGRFCTVKIGQKTRLGVHDAIATLCLIPAAFCAFTPGSPQCRESSGRQFKKKG